MIDYQGHPDQQFGHITYSQHGEDLMLLNLFKLMGIDKPSYLDVGAHHPETISNTKLLYDRGSRGVNVEANPNLMAAFMRDRQEDINLNVGVGIESGTMNFHMYSDTSGRNTFSYDETKTLEGVLNVNGIIRLPVVTLNMIVDQYREGMFPDLLSMDIEGWDYEVLDTANFDKTAPKVIIVETRKQFSNKMKSMMAKKRYFPYCRMGENLIFIHSNCMFNDCL